MPGVRDARRRHDGVGLRGVLARVRSGRTRADRDSQASAATGARPRDRGALPVRVLLVLRRVATVRRVATDSAAGCRVRRGVGVLWNRPDPSDPRVPDDQGPRRGGGIDPRSLPPRSMRCAPGSRACARSVATPGSGGRVPPARLRAAVPRAIIAADMAREIAYDLADGSLARSASRMRWCLGVVAITAAPFGLGIALAAWLERSIIADLGRSLRTNRPDRAPARAEG